MGTFFFNSRLTTGHRERADDTIEKGLTPLVLYVTERGSVRAAAITYRNEREKTR